MQRWDYFVEPAYPSLLHGDLWCGNVMLGSEGEAVLIDPAVCVGNREFDIALTRLFGGFEPAFYDAYNEAAPLESGFGERLDLPLHAEQCGDGGHQQHAHRARTSAFCEDARHGQRLPLF